MHRGHLVLHSDDSSQRIEKNPGGDAVCQGIRESDGERFATQHNPPTSVSIPDEFRLHSRPLRSMGTVPWTSAPAETRGPDS